MIQGASKKIKSRISILLAFCLLHHAGLLKGQSTPTASAAIDYTQLGAPIPPFNFMSYNDTSRSVDLKLVEKKYARNIYKTNTDSTGRYTHMSIADFSNGNNFVVMIFNPLCNHCEEVAFLLEKNVNFFQKNKIILLANKAMEFYIPNFAERHHVARYPCMYIGYDTSGFIDNTFLYETLPQLNIYSAQRKLIRTFSGDVHIDSLKKYLTYDKHHGRSKKA